MTGTSRELTISHGAQFPAQCLLGDDNAEFLEDPLAEVDDPPAHDAMHGRDRPLSSIAASAARCAPSFGAFLCIRLVCHIIMHARLSRTDGERRRARQDRIE